MVVLIALLLIILLVFGIGSMMQSYASAQQAQAQIETAKVAQVNAWGNLISILVLVLAIVVIIALIVAFLYWTAKRSQRSARRGQSSTSQTRGMTDQPQIDAGQLVQLATLKVLMSLTSDKSGEPQESLSLPQGTDQQSVEDDLFAWLK